MRRLFIAFALAAVTLPAAALDVPGLMKLLASTSEVTKPYTERKFSPLLVASVDSAGTLRYKRPDLLEKQVTQPRKERFRILADAVVIERGGKEQRIALSSQPALAAFAASLRGVLSGDAAQLQRYFTLKADGTDAAWTLELTPSDPAIKGYVECVVVTGRQGQVSRIETFEASGDRTLLEIP
jgi:outer membrane lipoprotein-sorting protein